MRQRQRCHYCQRLPNRYKRWHKKDGILFKDKILKKNPKYLFSIFEGSCAEFFLLTYILNTHNIHTINAGWLGVDVHFLHPGCQILSSMNNGWANWNQPLKNQKVTSEFSDRSRVRPILLSDIDYWRCSMPFPHTTNWWLLNWMSPTNTQISLQRSGGKRGATRTRVGGGLMTREDECVFTTAGSCAAFFFPLHFKGSQGWRGQVRSTCTVWQPKASKKEIKPLTRTITIKKKNVAAGAVQRAKQQIPHSLYTPPPLPFFNLF